MTVPRITFVAPHTHRDVIMSVSATGGSTEFRGFADGSYHEIVTDTPYFRAILDARKKNIADVFAHYMRKPAPTDL